MHGATNRGFDRMVRLLAENGSHLDREDSEGRTPMTFAEGVFLAINPPVRKTTTIGVLEELIEGRENSAGGR